MYGKRVIKWLNIAKNAFARLLVSQAGGATNKSAAQNAPHSCPFHSRALVVSNLAMEATILPARRKYPMEIRVFVQFLETPIEATGSPFEGTDRI